MIEAVNDNLGTATTAYERATPLIHEKRFSYKSLFWALNLRVFF